MNGPKDGKSFLRNHFSEMTINIDPFAQQTFKNGFYCMPRLFQKVIFYFVFSQYDECMESFNPYFLGTIKFELG